MEKVTKVSRFAVGFVVALVPTGLLAASLIQGVRIFAELNVFDEASGIAWLIGYWYILPGLYETRTKRLKLLVYGFASGIFFYSLSANIPSTVEALRSAQLSSAVAGSVAGAIIIVSESLYPDHGFVWKYSSNLISKGRNFIIGCAILGLVFGGIAGYYLSQIRYDWLRSWSFTNYPTTIALMAIWGALGVALAFAEWKTE
jgi:hypothetical protein